MAVLDRIGLTSVQVSWDGSGDFDGEYDETNGDVPMNAAVAVEVGRDQARAIGRPQAASAGWQLYNYHRRYSSEYSGSPLRTDLLPGRPCRIEKALGDDWLMDDPGVLMDDPGILMSGLESVRLFTGNTDQPKESYGNGAPATWFVEMRALGSLAKLQALDAVTVPLQTNITTGAALVLLLAAAGLTEDEYVVDQTMIDSGRLMPFWWADDRDPLSAAIELWATEGPTGALYEDQEGALNAEGSTYLADNDRSQEVQATFYSQPPSDELWLTGIEVVPGYQQIVNDISIPVDIRAAVAETVVFEYQGSISLSANESRTIFASVSDPLTGIVAPELTTDYTLGSGSLVSVVLSVIGALSVGITLTAGASGALVDPPAGGNGLQLRAQPVAVAATQTAIPTLSAVESQAEFGRRKLDDALKPWRCLDPDEAASVADAWLLTYGTNRPQINVAIVNGTGELLRQACQRRVSDLIRVEDLGVSGATLDLTIHQIRHEIMGDQRHTVVFGCEKRVEQDWARWDVDLWDTGRWGQ